MKTKRIIIAAVAAMTALVTMGCENNINEDFTLPNGKVVSQERYDELMSLKSRFEASRSIDDTESPLIVIEEMKQTLIDEYGDEAYDYFGDTELELPDENGSRSVVSNRNIEVELTDPNYIGWAETRVIDHWGIWWDYKEVEASLSYRGVVYNTGTISLLTDKAVATYSDSITSTKTVSEDWTYLDKVYEGNNVKELYDRAIASANRIIRVSGDTKWGWWFPKVTSVSMTVDFYDVLLKNGHAKVHISY